MQSKWLVMAVLRIGLGRSVVWSRCGTVAANITLAEWANLLFFGIFGVNGVDSVCGVTESVAARQLSFALAA